MSFGQRFKVSCFTASLLRKRLFGDFGKQRRNEYTLEAVVAGIHILNAGVLFVLKRIIWFRWQARRISA